MKWFLKLEEWLYHKLDIRWRKRATLQEIYNRQEWLNLDAKVKGGKSRHFYTV